jgi:hypothetical protein
MTDNFDVDADVYQGVDFERITENALDSVAVEVQNNWQDGMDQAGYRNTGETINSITIESPEQFVRLIGSDKTAALIGEVGRAPGAGHPPPDRLGDWVHEQAGLPDRGGSVEWSFGGETQTVTFDQAVFLIGRSINENGLEPHHFGERAANDATPLDEEIAERIEMALERQSTG